MGGEATAGEPVYSRHRPETTALHSIVRDHIATLYEAVEAGFGGVRLPDFVRRELEAYLDCGLLCRDFARLVCEACGQSHLVAFSCKGRAFCPSCLGRRMCQTAVNLIDHVLPVGVPLRQWVLTLPHSLRYRLAYDAPLLAAVVEVFDDTVLGWYARRLVGFGAGHAQGDANRARAKGGLVTVIQRTTSDLRLSPYIHAVLLDGAYVEEPDGTLEFLALPRLSTSDVADVLQIARVRILRLLVRRGVIEAADELTVLQDELLEREPALARLAQAAVTGNEPAGPQLRRRPPVAFPGRPGVEILGPLCAEELGFNLQAATRAGGQDPAAREALLRYMLRPPISNERLELLPSGLVRIALKKPFRDGTQAIDLDPLALLCRLCAAVPAPRAHTIHYAGVLAPNAKWRSRIVPPEPEAEPEPGGDESHEPAIPAGGPRCHYRPWAELLKRAFAIDVEKCPRCGGRMRLIALLTAPESIERFLSHIGEPTEPPPRAPARGPPYFITRAARRVGAVGASGQGELFTGQAE